jgi:hypothetical protein
MPRDPLAGLAKEVVQLPFIDGLANSFAAQFRPDPKDAMLVIENADLTQVGKFANRGGFTSLSNNRIGPEGGAGTILSAQMRLFQRDGELGCIANTQLALGSGAGWAGAGDTVFSFTKNIPATAEAGAWKGHGKIPRPTLSALSNLTPDTAVKSADMAVAGNFAIVAWHTVSNSNTGSNKHGDIFFRVVDITTDSTVIDTTPFPVTGTYVAARTVQVVAGSSYGLEYQAKLQCLAVGNFLYVFALASSNGTVGIPSNDVIGFFVDMAAANPAPTAMIALSGLANVSTFSVSTDGSSVFVASADFAAPLQAKLSQYSNSLFLITSTPAHLFAAPVTRISDLNCDAAFGVVAITYVVQNGLQPQQYVDVYNASTLALVGTIGEIVEFDGTTNGINTGFFRPDVVLLSSTLMMCCVSEDHGGLSAFAPGSVTTCVKWTRVSIVTGAVTNTTCPTVSSLFSFLAQGIFNVGRMFTINGRVFFPAVKTDIIPTTGAFVDAGYFLVEIDASVSQGGNDKWRLPMVSANWATDISAPVLETNLNSPLLPFVYGTTMTLTGTGSATITLTSTTPGSGLTLPYEIRVLVTLGGGLGTWTGKVSYDEGATFEQAFTSAASVDLTGKGEGFTMVIPGATTAVVNDRFDAAPLAPRQLFLPRGCVSGNKYYTTSRKGMDFGIHPNPYFSDYGLEAIVLDFADFYRWASRPFGSLTAFAGGAMFAYDGRRTFESGILTRPRIVSIGDQYNTINKFDDPVAGNVVLVTPGVNPLQPATQYFFRAVYTWLDAAGDRWFSAPSYADRDGDGFTHTTTSITVNPSGGGAIPATAQQLAVTVTMPQCFSGMVSGTDYFKNSMEVWLYMTNSQTPDILFLTAQVRADHNAFNSFYYDPFSKAAVVTFLINDEPFSTNDQIYTAGGELENSPAPPCRVLEAHRDRLFSISSYDNNVYYSKPRTGGRGLEWCQQTQLFQIPERGLGLASNETCLMIFTSRGVYAIEGYGPSVTGQPAQAFGALQLISNQMGLYEVNSCKTTPIGVIFRTNKGWWLIDRTLSMSYLGDGIDGMVTSTDRTIAVNVDQKKAVIRIMMDNPSGTPDYRQYNYWYDSKRWSVDTTALVYRYKDAMVLGDDYFVIDPFDVVASSGPNYGVTWLDGRFDTNGHGASVSTGWITVSNMAMLKRIWRVVATVENLCLDDASVALQMTVYADWVETPIVTGTWTSDIVGQGVQTVRLHLPQQKMKAIKIALKQLPFADVERVENNVPGYNLIGLGFEVGVKNRMSLEGAAKSA